MNKRSLLKAFPFAVATLPDGAALANASSAGCLIKDAEKDFPLAILRDRLPAPEQTADTAVRVTGLVFEWGNKLVFDLGPFNRYYADGTEAPPVPPGLKGKTVDLLVYFEASEDYTKITYIGPYPLVQPSDGFQGLSASCMASVATAKRP